MDSPPGIPVACARKNNTVLLVGQADQDVFSIEVIIQLLNLPLVPEQKIKRSTATSNQMFSPGIF